MLTSILVVPSKQLRWGRVGFKHRATQIRLYCAYTLHGMSYVQPNHIQTRTPWPPLCRWLWSWGTNNQATFDGTNTWTMMSIILVRWPYVAYCMWSDNDPTLSMDLKFTSEDTVPHLFLPPFPLSPMTTVSTVHSPLLLQPPWRRWYVTLLDFYFIFILTAISRA